MAAKKTLIDPARVVQVKTRLFVEDVEELKRRAVEAGFLEWQPLLRKLVHDALRERKVLR